MPTLTVTRDDDGPWIVTSDGVIVDTIRAHYDLNEVLDIAAARVPGVVLWKPIGVTGHDITLQAVVLPPMFVSEDSEGVPTIWLSDVDSLPRPLMDRSEGIAPLFDAIADLLAETRD